jgi:hypothetical protein
VINLLSANQDASGTARIQFQTSDGTVGQAEFLMPLVKMTDAVLDIGSNGKLMWNASTNSYLKHATLVGDSLGLFKFYEADTGNTQVEVGKLYANQRQVHFQSRQNELDNNSEMIEYNESNNRYDFYADGSRDYSSIRVGPGQIGTLPARDGSIVLAHADNYTGSAYALQQLANGTTHVNAKSGQDLILRVADVVCVRMSKPSGNTIWAFETPLPTGTGAAVVSSSGQLVRDTSSIRWKENVTDLDTSGGLPVYDLRPVTFDWKNGVVTARTRQAGLIAEEVQEHIPDAVVLNTDGDGEGLNNNVLVSHLIAAVQDLNGRLAALEQGTH